MNHCICGNVCRENNICESCEGKDSLYLEGEIFKKQKKSYKLMAYWFILLGNELYCYKSKGDEKHKEMRSLSGVFINNEMEETNESG